MKQELATDPGRVYSPITSSVELSYVFMETYVVAEKANQWKLRVGRKTSKGNTDGHYCSFDGKSELNPELVSIPRLADERLEAYCNEYYSRIEYTLF